MTFKNIFKDTNDYNEKTIIGFLSFVVMVITLGVDLIAKFLGKEIKVTEFIFNAFLFITLGSFGIAGLEKFTPGAKKEKEPPTTEEE
jgi:hypothetical protein